MITFKDGSDWLESRIDGVRRAYIIPEALNGGIAVDVGANVGAFPIVNHSKFTRIICVEPSEYSFNECLKNTKDLKIVEVYRYAVGSVSDEEVKLKCFKGAGNVSGNASTLVHESWDDDNFELVKTISIEDIFSRFKLSKIDYLKVDCEGGEYDFLINKELWNIDYLSIEIHQQLGDKAIVLENHLNKFFIPISQLGDGISTHKEITYKNRLL